MKQKHFVASRFRKFTLIELLVVIAIIAILASMLLPSLKNAQQAGQKASCQSQIKQLSLVMELYTDDGDNIYMLTFFGNVMWTERLVGLGYVSAKNAKAYYYCNAVDDTLTYRWYPGYGYVSPYLNTVQGKKRSRTEKPDRTALFSEINVIDDSGDPARYTWSNSKIGCWTMKGVGNYGYGYLQRHGDGVNFVFCDGHVEFLPNPYRLTGQLKGIIAPYRAGFPFSIP